MVISKRPRLSKPVLVVSVSTSLPQYRALYSQARELASYLIRLLKFEQFATLYSSALPPAVVIREDGTSRLVSDHFYHYRAERDIILFAGDGSPADEQYEFADEVLNFASRMGVKEIYSIGARWAEPLNPPLEVPKVLGFATDAAGVAELKANGVEIVRDEPAPFFANLIVGLAGLARMRGYKISVNHGEPVPHPKSTAQLIGVLSKMLGLEIEKGELENLARQVPSITQQAVPETEGKAEGEDIYH